MKHYVKRLQKNHHLDRRYQGGSVQSHTQGYIQSVAVNNCGKTRIISIPQECIQPTKKALYSDYQLEDLKEYFPQMEEINAI